MISRKRLALAAVLMLSAAPLWAADPVPPMPPAPPGPSAAPVAALAAPATAAVGAPLLLDPTGSSGDLLEFFTASGPVKPKVISIKDDAGVVSYGLVVPPVAGSYRFGLVAWGAAVAGGGKPAHAFAFVDVVVGTPAPPTPPTPPAPVGLTATFQAAYAKDADAAKGDYLDDLQALYRAAPALLTPSVTTVGQLGIALAGKTHAPGLLPSGAMPNLTAAVVAELGAELGTDANAPIDAAKATTAFSNIATALAGVRP